MAFQICSIYWLFLSKLLLAHIAKSVNEKWGFVTDIGITNLKSGLIIPVVITVFSDKSFTFITKTPPASVLLKRAAKLEKGSAESHRTKVGKVSKNQVKEIAEVKMPDLNAFDIDHAMSMVAGTARSMGITVEE